MLTVLSGLVAGWSLIVAIGAQNVFVLRQGVRRERIGLVVAVCAGSDAVLIVAGVAGLGAVVGAAPWLVDGARWGGAAFLLGYAVLAARRVLRPSGEGLSAPAPRDPARGSGNSTEVLVRRSAWPVLATTLALTWLNPHVYLDTLFLLGSLAAGHGDGRWLFAVGAGLASLTWFSALGFGSRHLAPWLERPGAWRVLDAAIAVVMTTLAVRLALGA